jgi:hypothetical protein
MKESNLEAANQAVRDLWDDAGDYNLPVNGWIPPAIVTEEIDLSMSRTSMALRLLAERGELVRAKTLAHPITIGNETYSYAPADAVEPAGNQYKRRGHA